MVVCCCVATGAGLCCQHIKVEAEALLADAQRGPGAGEAVQCLVAPALFVPALDPAAVDNLADLDLRNQLADFAFVADVAIGRQVHNAGLAFA